MLSDGDQDYSQLVERGASPLEIARIAHGQGLQGVAIIRLIRSLFTLQFVEAKEVAMQAVYGMGLNEYQETYIFPLLEELEREGLVEGEE